MDKLDRRARRALAGGLMLATLALGAGAAGAVGTAALTGGESAPSVAPGRGVDALLPQGGAVDLAPARALAARLAAELAERCPLAPPSDVAALDACRNAMFHGSALREALAPEVLWGRDGKFPGTPLAATGLTRFSPEALTAMYLPLFMFNGRWSVEYVATAGRARIRLEAAFRNRLAPGEFPYPFWHDASKWSAYENTHALLLWLTPGQPSIEVAQFTWRGPEAVGARIDPLPTPGFEGRWMWTDAAGQTQPKVTLFDSLYSPANPFRKRVDASYRGLALALREGDCLGCHSPENKGGMQRLLLLQTPLHAAGNIDAVLDSVKRDRMPIDNYGNETPLAAAARRKLIAQGEKFAAELRAARAWEAAHPAAPARVATGQ
ncbi:hypothetical protein [Derxia gummosa]|uniref:Cytochrome c domain-containing protein n=1 Tax=Derxia gummosa DSM 723 TaxID=1121388 RepID=A0A8B6X9V6_9BURK|nr:hypothetical protein [Derxia gummosa]